MRKINGATIGAYYRNKVAQLKAKPKKNKTDFSEAFGKIAERISDEELFEILSARLNKK